MTGTGWTRSTPLLSQGPDIYERAEAPSRWLSKWLRCPSSEAVVSVLVDSVEDAIDAVESGAHDLLLRDWDTERIGELRDALVEYPLVERGPFPLDTEYDTAAAALDSGRVQRLSESDRRFWSSAPSG